MCIDAKNMADIFDMGEVDRIYLNFSIHGQRTGMPRRLTSPQFMEVYDKILKKDGTVEFKTDNRGLLIIPWNRYQRQDGIF